MTESQIQDAIHSLYEGDTDTPSSTSEEYLTRRRLINAAINRWEYYENTLWNELWTRLEDATDGDKTTTANTYSYDCPSDFVFPGGYVRLVDSDGNSTYYAVVPVGKPQLFDNTDKNICYFTGNPKDGYKLNFLDTQTAGLTIKYEYYKKATTISDTTDVPEMSDPYFCVYYALAKMFRLDGKHGEATEAMMEAEQRLRNMKVKNIMPAWYQEHAVEDKDFVQGVAGFGE